MDPSFLAFAYLAGNVATVNPCGFAMLPAFVSYILGEDPGGHGQASPLPVRLWRALRLGAVVTAAFVGVFAAVGLVFAYLSRAIVEVVPWAALVVGALLVVWGITVVAGRATMTLRLPNPTGGRGGSRSALLFGVGYAVASLSCTLPVFMAVVAGTLVTGGVAAGVSGFVAYGAGMGTIVLAVAISVALARDRLVARLRRAGRHLERAAGAVLALAGLYIVAYWGYALGPGRRPSLGGSPPAAVGVVTRWAQVAARLLETPAGRTAVGLAATAVLVAIAVAVAGRRRHPPPPASDAGPSGGDPGTETAQVTVEECAACPTNQDEHASVTGGGTGGTGAD